MGYCPFSSFGRHKVGLYRDRQGTGLAYLLGHEAEHCDTARDTANLPARESDSVRARPCHNGVAIQFLYRGRGQPFVL